MIGHESRWATYSFSMIVLLSGLAAANAARADDAAFGCRADEQSTEMTTDCDSHVQEANVTIDKPPPPTTPPVILYMELPGEGAKHDHDRDRNGHAEHDDKGRRI